MTRPPVTLESIHLNQRKDMLRRLTLACADLLERFDCDPRDGLVPLVHRVRLVDALAGLVEVRLRLDLEGSEAYSTADLWEVVDDVRSALRLYLASLDRATGEAE